MGLLALLMGFSSFCNVNGAEIRDDDDGDDDDDDDEDYEDSSDSPDDEEDDGSHEFDDTLADLVDVEDGFGKHKGEAGYYDDADEKEAQKEEEEYVAKANN